MANEQRVLLEVLVRLSGPERRWVRCDRVLAAAGGLSCPAYHRLLAHSDWHFQPNMAGYLRLIEMILATPPWIEGAGHFGAPDSPPLEPVYNRCRPTDEALRRLRLLKGQG